MPVYGHAASSKTDIRVMHSGDATSRVARRKLVSGGWPSEHLSPGKNVGTGARGAPFAVNCYSWTTDCILLRR